MTQNKYPTVKLFFTSERILSWVYLAKKLI
jgi:hypothetical protein